VSAVEDDQPPTTIRMDSLSNPPAASRKRVRGTDSHPASNIVDLTEDDSEHSRGSRRQIEQLLESLPQDWSTLAARYDIEPRVDDVLCALGKEVAASLRSVEECAEEARQRLLSQRAAAHAAIDTRFEELLASLDAARCAKVAALERELEQVDAVLERTRREHAAARHAIASKSDAELDALSVDLIARLKDVSALLATLPHGPVEPSLLRLELDEGALLSSIRTAGTVLAPRGVHAADVVMRGLPTSVRPGRPLHFELALSDDYPCRARAELEAAAASLAFHACVTVSLETGAESQPLHVSCMPAASGKGVVTVSVAIPESAGRGAEVVVSSVTMARQSVISELMLPARLRIVRGVYAPLLLKGAANEYSCSPAITRDGTLYAPLYSSTDVLVFSADGTPLPVLPLVSVRLANRTCCVAFVDAAGALLLADVNGASSKLVAVDTASRAVRWSAALGGGCWGFAVLPAQDVVVVSDPKHGKLHVHRLSDGVRVASAEAARANYVAADPASGTVFASTGVHPSCGVSTFRWDGASLVAEGDVEAAGTADNWRPLAVMPPTLDRHTSYLVVGTRYWPTLLVLSLPDRRLVHTHTLEGMRVTGLAADPSGTALAVCDAAYKAIHVLLWPLPGMPPLQ
jgi:hypothetical protein